MVAMSLCFKSSLLAFQLRGLLQVNDILDHGIADSKVGEIGAVKETKMLKHATNQRSFVHYTVVDHFTPSLLFDANTTYRLVQDLSKTLF